MKRGVVILTALGGLLTTTVSQAASGDDLLPPFAAALQGRPLRAVAVGTSFTQAGEGWIKDWLATQFPDNSLVSLRNSGMSSMGLLFHNFRLERDVIALQPNLVLLESGPNDGDLDDEEKLQALESIIVRLKSLEHPPAIVIVDSSAANVAVNQRVAEHYGLLRINVHAAMQDAYARDPSLRSKLTIPDGHPSTEGHGFFAKTIAAALDPYLQEAKKGSSSRKSKLPERLSKKPLYHDAGLVQLTPQMGQGWSMSVDPEEALRRQYLGTLSTSQPGASLEIPVRGTAVGVFYSMKPGVYGRFYASLDGGTPREINTGTRGGYSFVLLGNHLPAQEHVLRIVYPSDADGKPVHLAYLMVAGDEGDSDKMEAQGPFDVNALKGLSFRPIPASAWAWAGPFGESADGADGRVAFQKNYSPEKWIPVSGEGSAVDFAKLTGFSDRGVNFAKTLIRAPSARMVLARFTVNYFGSIWLNGKEIVTVDSGHGSAADPLPFFPLDLAQGENELLVKIGSGSRGNDFSLSLSKCEDIEFTFPLSPER